MANPYTIKIFVPDGDPEGVKLIEHMNWTGLGISFPRDKWPETKQRTEFGKAGVYILVGYASEENDLPTLYIGQGDGVRNRIESHFQTKDFWDWGIAFVSMGAGLHRAHITWEAVEDTLTNPVSGFVVMRVHGRRELRFWRDKRFIGKVYDNTSGSGSLRDKPSPGPILRNHAP